MCNRPRLHEGIGPLRNGRQTVRDGGGGKRIDRRNNGQLRRRHFKTSTETETKGVKSMRFGIENQTVMPLSTHDSFGFDGIYSFDVPLWQFVFRSTFQNEL